MDDIRKTVSYARRNGIAGAISAARERMMLNRIPYHYEPCTPEALKEQRASFSRLVMEAGESSLPHFSVLVPAYKTDRTFLAEMIDSVKRQTYGAWELIIADASPAGARVRETAGEAHDSRVRYLQLSQNRGIAANTNEAALIATGDYLLFLDHDDLLTPDALYEMACAVMAQETPPFLVYGDEDKFEDAEGKERRFFEPHYKGAFDFEKLLSNNYICHPAAVRADLFRNLMMRSAYDGSQDHDLFLRIACMAIWPDGKDGRARTRNEVQKRIVHTGRVLYHWRAHALSTAQDPAHKNYAFGAAQRAIRDVLKDYGMEVTVEPLPHLGFYRTVYHPDLFEARKDVGVIGGCIRDRRGVTVGGCMDEEGHVFYEGTGANESGGYQHPAVLVQEADAVDLRAVRVRDELLTLYAAVTEDRTAADGTARGIIEDSLSFCRSVREAGYRILYDPQFVVPGDGEEDKEDRGRDEEENQPEEDTDGNEGDRDHSQS
ncbi:MAG: glycosyltransferase [Lachnospiraceae bacterium]|nr:glycosyltransferase [Lachnospiraceae bacterium]